MFKNSFFILSSKQSRFWALAFLLLVSSHGWASNRESEVQSIYDGQTPYLLVQKDSNGGFSTREVGVYSSNKNGDFEPILLGNILSGGANRGILEHLSITKQSHRYESIAVIDGKICIFHQRSKENDPKTYIKIGSPEWPLVDIHGHEVKVPDIKNIEDIQSISLEQNETGQLILISLKHDSIIGDGLTFGIILKHSTSAESNELEAYLPPTVLDYKFQLKNSLEKLKSSINPNQVLSKVGIESLLRKNAKEETDIMRMWKGRIRNVLLYIESIQNGKTSSFPDLRDTPLYDLSTGTFFINSKPTYISSVNHTLTIKQEIDPISHQNLAIIGDVHFIHGKINLNSNHTYKIYKSSGGDHSQATSSSLIYINNELYFFLPSQKTGKILAYKISAGKENVLPNHLDYLIYNVNDTLYLMITSLYDSERGITKLYQFKESDNALSLIKDLDIFNSYISPIELNYRTHRFKDGNNEFLLFDNKTPPQKNYSSYMQVAKETAPYLNLTETMLIHSPVIAFRKAIEDKEINSSAIRYKQYEDPHYTGLFSYGVKNKTPQKFVGELLSFTSKGTSEIFSKTYNVSEKMPIKVVIVAIDASFTHGANNFQLVTTISFDGAPTSTMAFDPIVFSTTYSIPFSALSSVQCLQGTKQNKNTLYFFNSFDSNPSTPEGAVYTAPVKFNFSEDSSSSSFNYEKLKISQVSATNIKPAMILDRIRFEADGKAFWVATDDVDKMDSKYKMINLFTGETVFPNTSSGRGLKFLSDELSRKVILDSDKNGFDSYYTKFSKWEIFGKYTAEKSLLEQRSIFFQKHQGKSNQNQAAILSDLEKLFVDFGKKLDDLANPKIPAKHVVFVVPTELKASLYEYARLKLLADKPKSDDHWNLDNKNAVFHCPDFSNPFQSEIIKNLDLIRQVKEDKKPVLFADLEHHVLQFPTVLKPEQGPQDESVYKVNFSESGEGQGTTPHLMYWLATEGRHLEGADLKKIPSLKKRISMVFIADPAQLAILKSEIPADEQQAVMNSFEENTDYLSNNWKIWPPNSPLASAGIKIIQSLPISSLERDVFPTLGETLNNLANPKVEPKHEVLLVQDDIIGLIEKLILTRWTNEQSDAKEDLWNYKNGNFDLYHFGPEGNPVVINSGLSDANARNSTQAHYQQQYFLKNLEELKNISAHKRAVLFVKLSDILKNARILNAVGASFTVKDTSVPDSSLVSSENTNLNIPPHILYLLATEGKQIQPLDFENSHLKNQISYLILGTQDQWEKIKQDLKVEAKVGLENHFSKISLSAPSLEVREELLMRIIHDPKIKNLGYKFELKDKSSKNLTPEESERKVISYLTNRSETFAKQFSKESTSAFLKLLSEFSKNLVEDTSLRTKKVIDELYIKRLVSKIYNLPLDLKILSPDDPDAILGNEKAPLMMYEAGYKGPNEIKLKFIETLLSKTEEDPGKTIPSSIIVYGDTSTGKTLLFKTLQKVLKLKTYDFNQTDNNEANAFIINAQRLSSTNNGGQDVLNIDVLLQHLDKFLLGPNGWRGFILIDDIHKADEEVRSKLLTAFQSLFDAPEGVTHIRDAKGQVKEVTVRNLSIVMTLNPTEDQEKLNRYHKNGNEIDLLVATLTSDRHILDRSFFARWGNILNLNKFPSSAKAPKLLDTLRESARNSFNLQSKLALISPKSVDNVVDQFPDANAREFVSSATRQLLRITNNVSSKSSFFIVVPSSIPATRQAVKLSVSDNIYSGVTKGGDSKIEDYIKSHNIAIPVDGRVEGKLQFLSMMLDTFRTNIFESLLGSISQNPKFSGDHVQIKSIFVPMTQAIVSNFIKRPLLPLQMLNLDPHDFNIKFRGGQKEFEKIIANDFTINNSNSSFPIQFSDEYDPENLIDELTDHSKKSSIELSRAHILTEASNKLVEYFTSYLKEYLRLKSLSTLPDEEAWLRGLPESDLSIESEVLGNNVAELFIETWKKLYDKDLIENRNSSKYATMSSYDAVRLYMFAIDRAITKLPWGRISKFTIDAVSKAVSNMELGQLPGFQYYLFSSKFSLLKPASHELLLQMAINSNAYKSLTEEYKKKMDDEFEINCSKFLERRRPSL